MSHHQRRRNLKRGHDEVNVAAAPASSPTAAPPSTSPTSGLERAASSTRRSSSPDSSPRPRQSKRLRTRAAASPSAQVSKSDDREALDVSMIAQVNPDDVAASGPSLLSMPLEALEQDAAKAQKCRMDPLTAPANEVAFSLPDLEPPSTIILCDSPSPHEHSLSAFDYLLSGKPVTVVPKESLCLGCFPVLLSTLMPDTSTNLSQARWDELLGTIDGDTTDDSRAEALGHIRETAGDWVSDAWLHAIQHCGLTLGAESPTSPVFASAVAVRMVERVTESQSTDTLTVQETRALAVKCALKDVARALLHAMEAYAEGATRTIVDSAMDLAMTPEFLDEYKPSHGSSQPPLRPWDLFLHAFNRAWTDSYTARGFESLVSPEELAWIAEQEAEETADQDRNDATSAHAPVQGSVRPSSPVLADALGVNPGSAVGTTTPIDDAAHDNLKGTGSE